MSESQSPLSLGPGATFAERYQVVRCIAAGGMGAVYEVIHIDTQRRRALKVMLPQLVSNDQLRQRFKQEATVVANVHSQHVVEITDAGVDVATGAPFIVMELLFGRDLQELLETKGPMNAHQLAEMLRQAAMALDRTHQAGIVHRDLKPENLFVTRRDDGTPHVKVLDFGIAKVVADGVKATNQTATIGTPLYMAPEQIQSKEEIGGATDTYALAQVAYTMLVGEAYFNEESDSSTNTFQLIMAVAHGVGESGHARAYRRRGVELPEKVNAWFMRATALEPARRFQTPGELAAAFKHAIGGTGDFRMSIPDTAEVMDRAPTVSPDSSNMSTSEFLASSTAASHQTTGPQTGPQTQPSVAPRPVTQIAAPGELPMRASATTSAAIAAPPVVPKKSGSAGLLIAGAAVLLAGGGATYWQVTADDDADTSEEIVLEDDDDKPRKSSSATPPGMATSCLGDMVKIPRGTFTMGGGEGLDAPVHDVMVGPYCIDKQEVSVGAYTKCVEAGKCQAQADIQWVGAGPRDHDKFDGSCNFGKPDKKNHPMNCVDWNQAEAFCAFVGKRLPRETEWELAARGTENRILPWGKGIPTPKNVNACGKECKTLFGKGARQWNMMYEEADPWAATAPVDAFADFPGPHGELNLAGNVMEWTSDWMEGYVGSSSVEEDPPPPAKPSEDPQKVARGGSFLSYSTTQVTGFHRKAYPVDFRNVSIGIRCALSVAK